MHVLVTADTIGGVWTYARELVTGLAGRGVRVTLVSFGEIPSASQTEWLEGLPGVDLRPTAFRLEWMQDAEEDLIASAEYLLSVISEVKPDILHCNQYYYGALPVSTPRILVAHSDVVSWWVGAHGDEPRDTRFMRFYRELVARGVSQATALVAPSRWMLEALRKYYVTNPCSSVIYNGRDPKRFHPHLTKEDYVLSVGRVWDAGKQVMLLAQAHPPCPVYVVGEERHPEGRLAGHAPAGGKKHRRVYFQGFQSEAQLRQLYGRASTYVATSRYEPFGLAAVEAALSRCALLVNDIPTFHELWGDAASYFRYNDSHSLQQQLARLRDDNELRLTYAGLAYHRALQRFSAQRMVDDYLNLYRALVPAEALVA